jgi:2-oxoglutarate ferredoxin oxidoreductase subunit alpha
VVLASGDIRECFYDAANAFNYAERYQLPVVHLVDKALANSYQIYPYFDTSKYRIDRGSIASKDDLEGGEYRRFKFTESGVSPRAFLGTENGIQWYTGDEHNEFGHITEHPSTRTRMVEKRMKKLELIGKEVPLKEKINFFGDRDASNMIVSWGSTKGAIIESVNRLREEGVKTGFLQVRMVHPLPADDLLKMMQKASRIVDVEMNYSGQLGGIIREKTGMHPDSFVVKYNGRPMTTTEVYGALKKALGSRPPKRQVLTHGA